MCFKVLTPGCLHIIFKTVVIILDRLTHKTCSILVEVHMLKKKDIDSQPVDPGTTYGSGGDLLLGCQKWLI